jgi:hypothetical protein
MGGRVIGERPKSDILEHASTIAKYAEEAAIVRRSPESAYTSA